MLNVTSIIDGKQTTTKNHSTIDVTNPFNGEIIAKVSCATVEEVIQAVERAEHTFTQTMQHMPAHERSTILRNAATLLEQQKEQFARTICKEAGKPIIEARSEVLRAVQLLLFASEEAKRLSGEQIPLDSAIGGENLIGFAKRVPVGVIAAITPFNFPLNLVLHKVAPAIAAGNTIVLKPAEKTPLSSILLHDLLMKAGLPKGVLNIIQGPGADIVEPLVTHPYVKKVTFTGSGKVGWQIKKMAEKTPVTLELGSNAPNIIFSDANLEHAAAMLTLSGYTFAGQACVSAQRIYVQKEVYEPFVSLLQQKVEALDIGDPALETTQLGPMITEDAAKRAEQWIQEAVTQGAIIRTGGERINRTFIKPTIIENVKKDMKVVCDEIFAPVVTVMPFEDEEEVISLANDSTYGLQAGVFTTDINRAFRFAEKLQVGGVWINDSSVRRFDQMPYGGIKESGTGKEGVKYAVESMTNLKFVGIKLI